MTARGWTCEEVIEMYWSLKDNPVPPVDVYENLGLVSQAVEYFRDLDSIEVTGAQVARLFELLLAVGRFPTEATDEIGLPEWPDWLL